MPIDLDAVAELHAELRARRPLVQSITNYVAMSVSANILLAAGPVGAGISLEYYFSTVDNERFGCASKVTHNIAGLFGVMEGADSDLRTGLPWQMVEIHEAMRLLVVVDARRPVQRAQREDQGRAAR